MDSTKDAYFSGLSRKNEKWTYSNGYPLGNFMPWAINEPSYDMNCIAYNVLNDAVLTQSLEWTTYDCNKISNLKLLCQYSSNISNPLSSMSSKLGCIREHNVDWNFKTTGICITGR